MRLKIFIAVVLFAAVLAALLYRPGPGSERAVYVYYSVDEEFAKPILDDFTKETGIKVIARTDSEATKTTGLVMRLLQMKDKPDGDVFWNSEQAMTLHLASKGVLQPYVSPNAASIPADYKDPGGLWTGFGCRARVVVFNTLRVKPEDAPKSLEDFANPRWKGRFAVAKPLFGTTRSHLAALALAIGEEKAAALLRAWRANGVIVAESNGRVVKEVVEGHADVGLTDNDDAISAQERKHPIGYAVLTQTADWPGAFLIPNTVSMLHHCPHPKEAQALIDYLLRPETEKRLAETGARQIPVRDVGAVLPAPLNDPKLKAAKVDTGKLAEKILPLGERAMKLLSGEEQ